MWKTLRPLLPDQHCADRGVILVNAGGGGWAFRTAPDLAPSLQTALTETRRLPRGAIETLVIIALHQPITRAEIEQIRGVSLSQLSMDVLLETGLIQLWRRKESQGRPTLWVTTPLFLSRFGLRSLRDLPGSHLTLPIPSARPGKGEGPRPASRSRSWRRTRSRLERSFSA